MLKELANVIKTTKPKNILQAIKSPSHGFWAFKYHYRRVSERDCVEFISKQWGCTTEEVDSAYNDLKRSSSLWKDIDDKLSIYPDRYGLQMTRELPSLYLMIRLIKPAKILETGVASGASSAYILRALHDNQKGRLYSIDLPADNLPEEKTSGFIVPQELHGRWSLHIGDSKEVLRPLLNEIGEIDCFIHDSLHTYDHMMFEFRTVWKYLCPHSLFLVHDVGANNAFFDFMKEKRISWKNYRVFHVLGAFRKVS